MSRYEQILKVGMFKKNITFLEKSLVYLKFENNTPKFAIFDPSKFNIKFSFSNFILTK